jgi:hypothetical protein
LDLQISFRVLGTRHQFAPAMAMKQTINGTVIHFVSDALFKGVPDLPYRRDLPTLGLREKGGQEFLFFFQSEILPSPPSFSWRFTQFKKLENVRLVQRGCSVSLALAPQWCTCVALA